jgi:integrase
MGNLKLAQRFLGHSTVKMTADIYTHTSAEAERNPVVPNIENGNNSAVLN